MNSEIVKDPLEDASRTVREWLARFEPEAPVVVVPVFEAFADTLDCLNSLFEHTPPGCPILLIDDASTDPRLTAHFEPLSLKDRFAYLAKPANRGFVDSVNLGFDLAGRRDAVIINSDVVVPARWLERLRAAAYSASTVATATPLTNHGAIVSVPYRNEPTGELPAGLTLAEIDKKIEDFSLLLRPPLPAAIGHCIYFKRTVLDLTGGFDPVFAPGYGEEVDLSQRIIMLGLSNVLADDLFVYHKGSRSFNDAEARQRLRDGHDAIIQKRYPWYRLAVAEAMSQVDAPLDRALDRARAAILGYKIALDVTCLDGTANGTQLGTLDLIKALVCYRNENQVGPTHLTLITRDDATGACPPEVARLVDEVVTVSEAKQRKQPAFDLAHRPFQIYSLEDLELLQTIAARFIVTHLDALAYAVPDYAADPDWWSKVRYFTRLTFGASDGIIFISREAQREIAHQGLEIAGDRSCVTYVGVDPSRDPLQPRIPAALSQPATGPAPKTGAMSEDNEDKDQLETPATGVFAPEEPFLLVLGANYRHKNRLFVMRLFAVLLERYGWDGRLIFAGPSKAEGGSLAEEQTELSRNARLKGRVTDLGKVTDAEKQWLLEHAGLVLYPSTVEGFGIVPFEAAWANTPALTGRISALAEILGDDEQITYLETFEPGEAAETVWQMLSQPHLAAQQIAALQKRAAAFSWERVAGRTWAFYREILGKPPRLPAAIDRQLTRYSELEQDHLKLQKWSAELNEKLVAIEKPGWRSRLKKVINLRKRI